jgi:hypothetical protein
MSIINLDSLVNVPNKQLIFSLITGEIYTIESDEMKNMDRYQIPLHKRPPQSCKVCYGRMHGGFNKTLKIYMPCSKCASKCVDYSILKSENIEIETTKNA